DLWMWSRGLVSIFGDRPRLRFGRRAAKTAFPRGAWERDPWTRSRNAVIRISSFPCRGFPRSQFLFSHLVRFNGPTATLGLRAGDDEGGIRVDQPFVAVGAAGMVFGGEPAPEFLGGVGETLRVKPGIVTVEV